MTAPVRAVSQYTQYFLSVFVGLSFLMPTLTGMAATADDRDALEPADASVGICVGDSCDGSSEFPVIALALPLSGPRTWLGEKVRAVMLESLSKLDGLKLVVFDTAGTVAGAEKSVDMAVRVGAVLIAGGIGDRESYSMASAAAKAHLSLVTMGRSDLAAFKVVQTTVSRRHLADALVSTVKASSPVDCAFVVRRNDQFGEAELAAFKAATDVAGIRLMGSRALPTSGEDEVSFAAEVSAFAKQYRELRKCRNEILHLIVDNNEARRLVEYLRFAGYFEAVNITVTGTRLFDDPGLAAQSGASLNGLVFVDLDVDEVFQKGANDLFAAELDDFVSVAAFAAMRIIESHASIGWVFPVKSVIPGRTGTLSWDGERLSGQRIKGCRISGRGIEYLDDQRNPEGSVGGAE